MNWNEILKKDLGTILRGGKAPHQAYDREEQHWPGPRYFRKRAWINDLLAIFSQLTAIVRCNAPMTAGLDAAKVDAPSPKLHAVLVALRDDIASGLSLSEAMARRPRFFPRYCADLVAAGERTGQLDSCLNQVSEHLLESRNYLNILAGYFAYLGGVLGVQVTLMIFLMTYVVPGFVGVFNDYGVEPPLFMRIVIQCGDYVRFRWWFIMFAASAAIIFIKLVFVALRRGRGSRYTAGLVLSRIPFLGTLLAKANLSHAAAVLERLLAGGVPIDTALDSVASSSINPLYAETFRRIKERVEAGETLTNAVDREPGMPESFRGFVSLGDSSGLLPEALRRVAQLYRRQVVKTTRVLLDVVTPLGILALGGLTLLFNGAMFATLVSLVDMVFYSL